jgi:hypothetical protein
VALLLVESGEKPEEHKLVLISEPPDEVISCGLILSGQGVQRFCMQKVWEGANMCGSVSHRTKAAVVVNTWHVTAGIWGSMRAGLLEKSSRMDEVLSEDWGIFDSDAHNAIGWLAQFQVAKMAKLGRGTSLAAWAIVGTQPLEDL